MTEDKGYDDAMKSINDQIQAINLNSERKDEAYMLAMSLVKPLRRLSPYYLAMVKQKFQATFIDAEFSMPEHPTHHNTTSVFPA